MRILIFSYSVAEWGGLQEWVTGLATGLVSAGHRIGLVSASDEISRRASAGGAETYNIVWDIADIDSVLDVVGDDWDVVLTTPLVARAIGGRVARRLAIPAVATFHGVYSDYVYSWKGDFAKIVAMAPALADMLRVVGAVRPSDLTVIPNSVPSSELDEEVLPLSVKMADGVFKIAIACRLESDKLPTLNILHHLLPKLNALGIFRVHLDLLGDGSQSGLFIARLNKYSESYPLFSFKLGGWVEREQLCNVLRHAVVTVGAGRTALHSLAVGTPVLGSGARAFVGLSSPARIQDLLDCNFGDYVPGRPLDSFDDLNLLVEDELYSEATVAGRRFIGNSYTESHSIVEFERLFDSIASGGK
ncbi:glycosyltransferase [Brevibacterium casei]|uniref:glycosyltransferase n=1 Tax=Brevibacterium casei TaxID=33889 RepID=UPI000AF97E6B|nr:glycosyltransferase [Brevibacterium casei]MCT2183970.1 glycosyltransferase [Brevibacterium casei]